MEEFALLMMTGLSLMNQQYKRSMLRKDNHKDKGKLWNPNEALGTRKIMMGKSNLRCGLRDRWKGDLQFDTRKRECSSHDLCVICSLREQCIHHSAHCWQLAFPGELIWWQQPALSCHFCQGWEAYFYHAELIALTWHHACTQIGVCLLWGKDRH